jgi:hypothetical protein
LHPQQQSLQLQQRGSLHFTERSQIRTLAFAIGMSSPRAGQG